MSISNIGPTQYPTLIANRVAAPAAPAPVTVASVPGQVSAASYNYNWNYANPREHIFDTPYDGYAMNKGLMKLGGVGFWTRFGVTRAIASAITHIPSERLKAYAVREKLMKVPGMRPDGARMFQLAYAQATGGQQSLWRNAPLSWLAQYAAPGSVNDWIVRGPLQVQLQTTALQYAMQTGFRPDVPGNREIEQLAQQAAMIAPPAYYGQQPGYPGQYPGGYPQPGYPGQYPGYGYADPINQIGNLIGQIGNIFR